MKSQVMSFNHLNYSIKKAFYSFEGYMNEYNDEYSYSGFEALFALVFKEIKNPSHNTIENRGLIYKYYQVIRGRIYLIDNGDVNNICLENKAFANDFSELKIIFESTPWQFNPFQKVANSVFFPALQNHSVKDILGDIEDEIEPQELKFNSFKNSIKQNGFFDLPKVQELSPDNQTELIKYILNGSRALGVAMFDFLEYFTFLDDFFKTKEKANKFVNRLYNEDLKDGSEIRKLRGSIVKPNKNHNSQKYINEVKNYYQSIK
jgi:hypothetical protein